MDTKRCGRCARELPLSEFNKHRRRKDGLQIWCKSCSRERALKSYYDLKSKIFDILGRKCVICGFDDIRALQIDHVFGGGREHIRQHIGTFSYYKSILEELKSIPEAKEKYQILCANHNCIKRIMNREVRLAVGN